jgi:hypothetical protein
MRWRAQPPTSEGESGVWLKRFRSSKCLRRKGAKIGARARDIQYDYALVCHSLFNCHCVVDGLCVGVHVSRRRQRIVANVSCACLARGTLGWTVCVLNDCVQIGLHRGQGRGQLIGFKCPPRRKFTLGQRNFPALHLNPSFFVGALFNGGYRFKSHIFNKLHFYRLAPIKSCFDRKSCDVLPTPRFQ